jgi:aryl-alcohol dehydrogenase-like predicted oxidoreductase
VLHHAIKSGINLVDVAPWYGHGAAERALGDALQGVPRQAYYLTTK